MFVLLLLAGCGWAAVDAVLASGALAQGAEVAGFEEEFAEEVTPGCSAVAVNSGTSALHLGLLAAGIGPGDEVLVPSFTFAATANAVALTGATPVFVDIEAEHFTMSPEAAASAITERTRGAAARPWSPAASAARRRPRMGQAPTGAASCAT